MMHAAAPPTDFDDAWQETVSGIRSFIESMKEEGERSNKFCRGDIVRARGCAATDPGSSIDDLLVTSATDPCGLVMLAARTPEGVFDASTPFIARADELFLVRRPGKPSRDTTINREGLARLGAEGFGALIDALESGPAGEEWTREDLETLASEALAQIATLIRRGHPIVLPGLGTFFSVPKTGHPGTSTVRFVPTRGCWPTQGVAHDDPALDIGPSAQRRVPYQRLELDSRHLRRSAVPAQCKRHCTDPP